MALRVAARTRGEIIGADSRQLFRELTIGVCSPSAAERSGVPHRLIGEVSLAERFTARDYASRARAYIARIHAAGGAVIVAGGTGLYIGALLGGLTDLPEDAACRQRLETELRAAGSAALHERLARLDAASAERIHPHDGLRIVRALEVIELAGRPLSALTDGHYRTPRPPWQARLVVLARPRHELYARIDRRVEQMVVDGVIDETRALLEAGLREALVSRKALGYEAWIAVLEGSATLAEATRRVQQAHRQYAKRQITWFRHAPGAEWRMLGAPAAEDVLAAELIAWLEAGGASD